MTTQTITEFVNKEIETWGFDYVEELFDSGYEPVLLAEANGSTKYVWLLGAKMPAIASHR